jgi:nucleoside-diphosphate-sugar epimerase
MRAYVTGATGFIGGHLIRALRAEGHDVTALVRPSSTRMDTLRELGIACAQGDVTDLDSLVRSMPGHDVVLHLAAAVAGPQDDWGWQHSVGVRGTEHVLEAATTAGVPRIVHMSSVAVYDAVKPGVPIVEETPLVEDLAGAGLYTRQKVLAERAVWRADSQGRIAATCIRPPMVIGPGDPNLLNLMRAMLGSPIGQIARDEGARMPIVVVEELAQGLVRAATVDEARGKAYNLASTAFVTKGELGRAFLDAGMTPLPRSPKARAAMLALIAGVRVAELPFRLVAPTRMPITTRLAVRVLARGRRSPQQDTLMSSARAQCELGWQAAACRAVRWHDAHMLAARS